MSAARGCGRQIVAAVVSATPEDWYLAVVLNWSSGLLRKIAEDCPRLVIL